ncbi:hypothetical protein [Cellulosimicrobium sp. NPDC057862]|uniref:hypothetical protein n=1 Tax=Cellulosimicrobium sp. NPDC057862 TaxID=3346266 RepID=UPI003672FB3D
MTNPAAGRERSQDPRQALVHHVLRRTLASIVTLLTAGIVAVAAAPSASAQSDGVYSVPYSGTLFYHSHAGQYHQPINYQEWVDLGRPTPRPAPTSFVKYPWSSTIYAVTFFDSASYQWEWKKLTYAEWSRAGKPTPRSAGWIEGSFYYQWGTNSSEVFVYLDEETHKLTFNQWTAAGSPTPEVLSDAGFFKLTWNSTIVYYDSIANQDVYSVTPAWWKSEGSPTPRSARMLPGDEVCSTSGSPSLYYRGWSYSGWLTLDQWRAAGSPAPTCTV